MVTRSRKRKDARSKKLSAAEIGGLLLAQQEFQKALQTFQQVSQRKAEIMQSVGLDPDKNYNIADDGTVTEAVAPVVE